MKVMLKSFGALTSPYDVRDYKLVASKTDELPETFELPKVPVKNQGAVNSCVAHAVASTVEYHHKRQHDEKKSFSTEFIYGFRDVGYYVGKGMYVRNALNTLRKYGDVLLTDLKGNNEYQQAMENVIANFDELVEKAYPHRISSYFRIYDNDAVKNALMNHGYVVVLMKWHDEATLEDGVYTPNGQFCGRHAVVIYGWNKKGWLCQNSWGTSWGNKGRFIIPFDFKFDEIWGVTDEITEDIVKPKTSKFWKFLYKIYNAIVNLFIGKGNNK